MTTQNTGFDGHKENEELTALDCKAGWFGRCHQDSTSCIVIRYLHNAIWFLLKYVEKREALKDCSISALNERLLRLDEQYVSARLLVEGFDFEQIKADRRYAGSKQVEAYIAVQCAAKIGKVADSIADAHKAWVCAENAMDAAQAEVDTANNTCNSWAKSRHLCAVSKGKYSVSLWVVGPADRACPGGKIREVHFIEGQHCEIRNQDDGAVTVAIENDVEVLLQEPDFGAHFDIVELQRACE